jgi:hypothetical protein
MKTKSRLPVFLFIVLGIIYAFYSVFAEGKQVTRPTTSGQPQDSVPPALVHEEIIPG